MLLIAAVTGRPWNARYTVGEVGNHSQPGLSEDERMTLVVKKGELCPSRFECHLVFVNQVGIRIKSQRKTVCVTLAKY